MAAFHLVVRHHQEVVLYEDVEFRGGRGVPVLRVRRERVLARHVARRRIGAGHVPIEVAGTVAGGAAGGKG